MSGRDGNRRNRQIKRQQLPHKSGPQPIRRSDAIVVQGVTIKIWDNIIEVTTESNQKSGGVTDD